MAQPANPAEAKRLLGRFAKQLREYIAGTADELTPFIEPGLAEYVASGIERISRENVSLAEALGLAQSEAGAPAIKNRASDPGGHQKQQRLIFNAMQLRSEQPPVQWAAIPHRIGYAGSWRQLQKLCLEKVDPVSQAALALAAKPMKARGRTRRPPMSP